MEIGGRICHCIINGADLPTVYIGEMMGCADHVKKVAELCGVRCNLIAYEVEDWNRDLSPWEFTLNKKTSFSGGGQKTLDWLVNECIPQSRSKFGLRGKRIICGYSLAGLFSLWAFYESQAFAGVISCSGSLWFGNWLSCAENHSAPENSSVYLSLGDREEHARDRIMATVGDCTRRQFELVRKDENVSRKILEWNEGGHFSEPEKRLAKGIFWTIANPVLGGVPYGEVTVEDVRRWMMKNKDEKSVAEAFKIAGEKAAYDESGEWLLLENELRQGILSIMESQGYIIPSNGQLSVLKPFMLRNGYICGEGGWWLPK